MKFKNALLSCVAVTGLILGMSAAQAAGDKAEPKMVTMTIVTVSGDYMLSANEMIGQDVHDANGETIATVDDLLVTNTDRMVVAVLSVGGFLGINDKLVAVPYDTLTMGEKGVTIAGLSKKKLEEMTEVKYRDDETLGLSRHRYVARMDRTMNQWSAKIDRAYDASTAKAKQGATAVSKESAEAWEKTKAAFRNLKDASGEAWEDAKVAFERSLDDLGDRWDDATN